MYMYFSLNVYKYKHFRKFRVGCKRKDKLKFKADIFVAFNQLNFNQLKYFQPD